MMRPHADIDPDGLLEYSVVFTDRSLNHMSQRFVGIMQQTIDVLCEAYNADSAALVNGGGSFAKESDARHLATNRRALIVRNGLFSYRWSQILKMGGVASDITVCLARSDGDDVRAAWSPAPIDEVAAAIRAKRPEVVFAPHVETAAGIILTDDYVRALADAAHEVGGVLVLDCIASGAMWVDMRDLGVDVLLSAPQKGWSGSPGVRQMIETRERGFDALRDTQIELGGRVRALLSEHGLPSVAAADFASPTVVVVHTADPELRTGAAFRQHGVQVAAGVPLYCDEPEGFSFRVGLFGLDKLDDVDAAVARLERALLAVRV